MLESSYLITINNFFINVGTGSVRHEGYEVSFLHSSLCALHLRLEQRSKLTRVLALAEECLQSVRVFYLYHLPVKSQGAWSGQGTVRGCSQER